MMARLGSPLSRWLDDREAGSQTWRLLIRSALPVVIAEGSKLFNGRIHFDGVSQASASDGKPIDQLNVRLDDRRWTVRKAQVDLDFGYSLGLMLNGPGVSHNARRSQSSAWYGPVFLRDGGLYLKIEETDRFFMPSSRPRETNESSGPVRLRLVD